MTQTNRLIPLPLLLLGLALATTLMLVQIFDLDLPKIAPGHSAPDLTLEAVSPMPFNSNVLADGSVQASIPLDGVRFPDFPDCKDVSLDGCRWAASLRRKPTGEDTVIETTLTRNGQVIGRAQVLEIETAEYQELYPLARNGHARAWISHIEVARAYQGNGLGRLMWRASDVTLKLVVGAGNAIHIFVDLTGWGPALMRNIPQADVILEWADYWAYIVR